MDRPARDELSVRQYGAAPGAHSHAHFQVLLGLDGVLELEVEGRGRRVGAGEGLVIAPGNRHDFESAKGASCLVLDSAHPAWAALATLTPPPDLWPLARYLASACAAGRVRAQSLGPALMLEAWAPSPTNQRPRRPIDWTALNAWARARAALPLSVADLASQVHLSPAQFTERCRQDWGMAPMAWLRALRLDMARRLRASALPVAEVARRCGYQSPSALTAALRRQTRITPLPGDEQPSACDDARG